MIMDLHMINRTHRVAFSENVLQDIGMMRGKYETYGKNLRILHLSVMPKKCWKEWEWTCELSLQMIKKMCHKVSSATDTTQINK